MDTLELGIHPRQEMALSVGLRKIHLLLTLNPYLGFNWLVAEASQQPAGTTFRERVIFVHYAPIYYLKLFIAR